MSINMTSHFEAVAILLNKQNDNFSGYARIGQHFAYCTGSFNSDNRTCKIENVDILVTVENIYNDLFNCGNKYIIMDDKAINFVKSVYELEQYDGAIE